MAKRIAYFEYGRVYPQPEGVPLVDGGDPVVPESQPEYDPPRLHICRVLLVFWCIGFAAMLGSSYIYVIQLSPWSRPIMFGRLSPSAR